MATRFERRHAHNRQRLLVAADCLIAALEITRNDSSLRDVREDLAQLQDNIANMRRVIARQPLGGLTPWAFVLATCLWLST
jgi:hypothetical protein